MINPHEIHEDELMNDAELMAAEHVHQLDHDLLNNVVDMEEDQGEDWQDHDNHSDQARHLTHLGFVNLLEPE